MNWITYRPQNYDFRTETTTYHVSTIVGDEIYKLLDLVTPSSKNFFRYVVELNKIELLLYGITTTKQGEDTNGI